MEPEPDTACSMESVGVGMDYVCSGFETGIGYSYTVSAVNCNGAQEGPEASFTIRPQGTYVGALFSSTRSLCNYRTVISSESSQCLIAHYKHCN